MLSIERLTVSPPSYAVMVGTLGHSIGTIAREATACYTFNPKHPGSYSAPFLRQIVELLEGLNKKEEGSFYLAMGQGEN